jgi:hypothetical protein
LVAGVKVVAMGGVAIFEGAPYVLIDAIMRTSIRENELEDTDARSTRASSLFLVLMVAIAVVVATWLALPWISAARNEKIEEGPQQRRRDACESRTAKGQPVASGLSNRRRPLRSRTRTASSRIWWARTVMTPSVRVARNLSGSSWRPFSK